MKLPVMLAGFALLALPAAASAQDSCPSGLLCAANPQGIVSALQAEGYQAKLTKDSLGDPMIESSASGYDYNIEFYGCDDHKACTSLRFIIWFKDDGTNTPQLANNWNKRKRFIQMAAQDDGRLTVAYDVSTLGGLNKANFADTVDWWQTMLGDVRTYFNEQPGG
jgi:hypothetical protein